MKLIGVHTALPRILVPLHEAPRWKKGLGDALTKIAWKQHGDTWTKAVEIDRVSFDLRVGDSARFAIDSNLGAIGWLPAKAGGGTFVCWLDATRQGTGTFPDGKVAPLVPPRTKRLGQVTLDGPQVLACKDIAPGTKGLEWIDIPVGAGRYEVGFAAANKTPLGKLAFITLSPLGTVAPAPAPRPPSASPKAKRLATVTGGAEGVVLLPAAAAPRWRTELWPRAATSQARRALSLEIGPRDNGLVIGTDLGMTLYTTDGGALIVVHGGTAPDEALAASAQLAKWKRRAKPFVVDAAGVVFAYSATEDRKAGLGKPLALRAGTYDVEYIWGANIEGTTLSAIRLTRRA